MNASLKCIKVLILVTTFTALSMGTKASLKSTGCGSGCGKFKKYFNSSTLVNKDCVDYCEDFVYAATRRQFCGCTNSLESLVPIHGDEQCDETCPGDQAKSKADPCSGETCCGGEAAYSLFSVDGEGPCMVRIFSPKWKGYLQSGLPPVKIMGLNRAFYVKNKYQAIWYMSTADNEKEILFMDWFKGNYLWSSQGSYLAPLPQVYNIADVGWILKKDPDEKEIQIHNRINQYLVTVLADGDMYARMAKLDKKIVKNHSFYWKLEKAMGNCTMFSKYFNE